MNLNKLSSIKSLPLNKITELKYGESLPKEKRISGDYYVYGSNGVIGKHNRYLVNHSTIIVGRKGSVGKVILTTNPCFVIDTAFYVKLIDKNIFLKYLYYFLFLVSLNITSKGVKPGINRIEYLNNLIPVPIRNGKPDLEEQKRIANKIDTLFSEIDKGIKKTKISLTITKDFVHSVLRNTFINNISFNYKIVEFNETINKDTSFKIGKIKKEQYMDEGKYPIIDQGQELIGGYSNCEDLIFKGDFPLIVYGDHTQAIKYIDFKFIQGADGIKLLFPNKNISCRFLYYLLETFKPIDNKYARHYKELKKLKFPVPYKNNNFDLEEQIKVAKKLDTIFNFSKVLQNELQNQLNNFEFLKQSILNEAFKGRL